MEWWGYSIIGVLGSIIGFLYFKGKGNNSLLNELFKSTEKRLRKEIEIEKEGIKKEKESKEELVKKIDSVLKEKKRNLDNLDESTKKIYEKYIANPDDMLNRIDTIISQTKKEIESK